MTRNQSIGVFDSSLGGLTILRALVERLPHYRYVYLGDTARAPYGDRSREEILRFSKEAIDFLFKEGCELVIFACNTVSAEALRSIQQGYLKERYGGRKRVLGVIVPTVEHVASDSSRRKVGVLGTRGTVESGTYREEFKKIAPHIEVVQNAAPLLVPLVEAGEQGTERAEGLVKESVEPFLRAGVDTVILGCTHYEHLLPELKRALGESATIVSQSGVVADKLAGYLARHPEMEETLSLAGGVTFYTTDTTGRFERESARFFGRAVEAREAKL